MGITPVQCPTTARGGGAVRIKFGPEVVLASATNAEVRHGRPDTHVVFARVGDWQPRLPALTGMLSPREALTVQRRRRQQDRDGLTLAYAMQRLLLGAAMDVAPASVSLGRDARGRPFVAGEPWSTSLSHADGAIAVAVSAGDAVGVDLEPAAAVRSMPEIAGRVACAHERYVLGGLDPQRQAMELLALWVRKEALLKAAGVGLAIGMERFAAPDAAVVRPPGSPRAFRVRMLPAGPQWQAAVATATDSHVVWGWAMPPDQPVGAVSLEGAFVAREPEWKESGA